MRGGLQGNGRLFGARRMVGVLVLLLLAPAVPAGAQPEGTDLGPYAVEPHPLTLAECARCHPVQFGSLKAEGGKHRFACRECHEVFHAYNPRRDNFIELMPKCASCHAEPHGAEITDCLSCHSNPHAPLTVAATSELGGLCATCHGSPARALQGAPSAHTEMGCQSCHHQEHGYIPDCAECHAPHYQDQSFGECTGCHPAHEPLNVTLSARDDAASCGGCHPGVFDKWRTTPSKHGEVNCTVCHRGHGQIPDCHQCHQPPHGEKLLEMYPDCLTCHLDVHDMPVKK